MGGSSALLLKSMYLLVAISDLTGGLGDLDESGGPIQSSLFAAF